MSDFGKIFNELSRRFEALPDPGERGISLEAYKEAVRIAVGFRDLLGINALTGAKNRSFLEMHWPEFNNAAFILLDIVCFKNFNDRFGHDAGDSILQTFSDYISKNIRDVDHCVRVGGDEFVVIVRDSRPETLNALRERLESLFPFEIELAGQKVQIDSYVCPPVQIDSTKEMKYYFDEAGIERIKEKRKAAESLTTPKLRSPSTSKIAYVPLNLPA